MVLEGSCVYRNSKLVLRDNTYSTIQWDAFTQPEVHNFIQILQREEEIYADKVDMVSVTSLLWAGMTLASFWDLLKNGRRGEPDNEAK